MKVSKKIDNSLSDQYQHNNYNINKSQNSQFNSGADSNEIKDLNIG